MSKKNCSIEGKAKVVLNLLSDIAVIVDKKGRLIVVNDVFEEETGLSQKEVTGKPFLELEVLPAESKKILLENLKKRLQGLPVEPYEVYFTDKTGKSKCVEVKGRKVSYAGQPADLVVFHDITRRKENARRLKEYAEKMEALVEEKVKEIKANEAKFRAITDSALDAMFMFDEEDKIVYWNPAAKRVFGYTENEIVGNEVNATLVPPRFREEHLKLTAKLVRSQNSTGVGGHWEFPALRKDGTEFSMELSMAPLQLNDKTYLIAIARDVTEEKRMQDALREEHYKLEAIANSIGAGFVVVSKDYRISWANKFIREYKGDVDGKLCYATLNSLDAPCPDCGVKKVFEQGALSDSHEYTSMDIRGNPYWVELIATPIKDADGKVETAIEVCVDITEKKNLQSKLADYSHNLERIVEERTEQLRQTQNKLVKSERLAAIGELAGMVGHDLRNPLTSIKNAAYYLKKKQSSGSEDHIKKMLGVIDSAVAYANKIISDLQDYSREMLLELVNCSPRSILQEALSLVQVPERVKMIDETLEEPVIRADKAKMVRVFINIVKNAVDAMLEGGTLQVKSTQTDGNVQISFADTGIGIPKETLGKLFSPLVTTKAQGMGFGLAICKRIVEAHQGRITVESVEGKGSTFTVTIPAEPKLKDGGEETWVNVPESLLSTTTKT